MGLIDRFITSFRSEDRGIAEPPGLVQNDDGTVDYVRPDGSRTPIDNGGSSSLPWASFQNVAGNTTFPGTPTTISANGSGLIGFSPNVHGAGDLALVTHGPDQFGDPTFFIPEVGCYLVSFVCLASGPFLANGVDPANVAFEVTVFNSEHDPFFNVRVNDPTNAGGNLALVGASSAAINVYAADTAAPQRGFQFQAIPTNVDLNVLDNFVQIKIVQLATT